MRIADRFLSAVWLGAGVFILLVSPAVFRAAGSPAIAANVVGAMLNRWHYIALGAPVALLLLEWKRARTSVIAVLFAAVILASTQAVVDLRIRAIRMASPVPISALQREHPLRRHFGMLHGISAMLLVAETLLAAVHAARREE